MPDPLADYVELEVEYSIWDRFPLVLPFVLIGTRDEDGRPNLAPNNLVTPLGWENYFGFVCTPTHPTYRNAEREGFFTVSYPRPEQVVQVAVASSFRCDEHDSEVLESLPTVPATRGDAVLLRDAYLHLECELLKIVDGFGRTRLVTGEVITARVHQDVRLRVDRDTQDVILNNQLLAYVHPGRVTKIRHTHALPFPAELRR
jgi:flavin reductase (DIM6/NTAB) family NADH-FMN oxidoreductase RutF